MDNLSEGSLVNAELSIGRHPAIVLSTEEEIKTDGKVRVVGISSNTTISLPEDRIAIPPGLNLPKKCYVQCEVLETLHLREVESRHRKAFGPFFEKVKKQVKAVVERRKKSTQS